jgi:hypothetical protein
MIRSRIILIDDTDSPLVVNGVAEKIFADISVEQIRGVTAPNG